MIRGKTEAHKQNTCGQMDANRMVDEICSQMSINLTKTKYDMPLLPSLNNYGK